MKVLLDTNVLISVMKPTGEVFHTIDRLWRQDSFQLPLSKDLVRELARALTYPKLRSFHGLQESDLQAFIMDLGQRASIEDVALRESYPSLRDPKDAVVLCAAERLRPDVIVTGDKDLLVLEQHDGIPIVSPRQFAGRF